MCVLEFDIVSYTAANAYRGALEEHAKLKNRELLFPIGEIPGRHNPER
jgi:hypothetical protein